MRHAKGNVRPTIRSTCINDHINKKYKNSYGENFQIATFKNKIFIKRVILKGLKERKLGSTDLLGWSVISYTTRRLHRNSDSSNSISGELVGYLCTRVRWERSSAVSLRYFPLSDIQLAS